MTKTIAEIGINCNGDISLVKRLIDVAYTAGFDYVKFQKRDITSCVPEHKKNEEKILEDGTVTTYYEYKKLMEFNFSGYIEISDYCKGRIGWFASAWDIESVLFLRAFTDIIKVPSALITNIELLKLCREEFKTVIISTGMSTESEIAGAIRAGKPDVVLHCNSSYPTSIEELNLSYIKWLIDNSDNTFEIGYSGHEIGLQMTLCAVALGATWVERHVTLNRHMWGSDQLCSIEPVGMFKLIKNIRDFENAFGEYGPREVSESEKSKRKDLRKDFLEL